VNEKCLDVAEEDFKKIAGIPNGIARIFECPMQRHLSANHRKNCSIKVKLRLKD
jgi:hypothetical protein